MRSFCISYSSTLLTDNLFKMTILATIRGTIVSHVRLTEMLPTRANTIPSFFAFFPSNYWDILSTLFTHCAFEFSYALE